MALASSFVVRKNLLQLQAARCCTLSNSYYASSNESKKHTSGNLQQHRHVHHTYYPSYSNSDVQLPGTGKQLYNNSTHLTTKCLSNLGQSQLTRQFSSTMKPLNFNARQPLQCRNSSFFKQKDSLPRLPVPELHETMEKFLKSARPLVTPEEFSTTENLVNNFIKAGGVGEKLQTFLVDRAAKKENWMTEWWIDTAYFMFRMPVVVWSSPGLVFPLVEFKTEDDQLQYAAKLIAGALDYKDLLDNDCIPIEMMGKTQLDMSQYFKIFSTCRVPGLTKDSVKHFMLDKDPPKHIIVMHNNHVFKLDVYSKSGKSLTVEQLVSQLRDILEQSPKPTAPVGLLTTQNRNVWGQAYKTLSKAHPSHLPHLDAIQRALFVVCLDAVVPASTGNPMTDAALQCVHGGGTKGNSANRWFDKTIQFIVGRSGRVGLTYEHSPAEGPPIANLMDHIVSYMDSGAPSKASPSGDVSSTPERLQFEVPAVLEAEMTRAGEVLDSLVDDLEMTCFNFDGFGKNFIKSQKISPDSFIQMAIQLAFYSIHDEPAAHYESGSTRMFLHGRTETIRSCSEESVAFCRAMVAPPTGAGGQLKLAAMHAAIQAHKTYVQQAVSGKGVDRHLLGLKLAAVEQGLDVPPLFMDVAYARTSHMRISSSQVAAKCAAFMCYGPLVPDGYGCCYNPRADSIVFGTSALNSSPETNSPAFRAALEKALTDMHDLLLKERSLKAKL